MPGPVSDSYDPEFGTGQNAQDVGEAIVEVGKRIDGLIGRDLMNIVSVVHSLTDGPQFSVTLTERELRIIRFCLIRSLDSI